MADLNSNGSTASVTNRKVVLFTKPDGDVRKMRITSRRLFLNFRNSMEEYKPLADRLREELPEERFRVYEI